MGIVLRAADIPVADRVDVIHEAICSDVLPVEIGWDRPAAEIDLVCRVSDLGPVNHSAARSGDNALWRTARQARTDHDPAVFVAVQVAGSSRIEQGERRTVLRPGDLTFYDTTRPYAISNPGRTELHYLRVPRSALALTRHDLDAVLGARVGPGDNPLAATATPFLVALGRAEVLGRPGDAALLAGPVVELLRALALAQAGSTALDQRGRPADAALALRVSTWVTDHLGDRDLGAASIAAAHHVSTRRLFRALEAEGLRLHDLVWGRRLEACRRDLRDPARAHLAVATISARWGFADPSHFGRVFRATYGVTPRQWRAGEG